MIAFLPLLLRFLPYLIAVAAIAGSYFYAYEKGKSAEHLQVVAVEQEFAAYRAKEAAIVAGIASEWDKKRQESEATTQTLEKERAERFSSLQDRARSLAGAGSHSYAGGAVRLFDDARAAAETSGTPAKSPEAAPAPSSSTEEYIVALYGWAAVCKERVDAWVNFYASLRGPS